MLDEVKLSSYLKKAIPDFGNLVRVQKMKGGRSNPNYLLTTTNSKFVLRSQPHGPLLKTAHDMGREYRVLSALSNTVVPVPKVFHLCEDPEIMGVSFYVMAFVKGDICQSFYLSHLDNSQRRMTYLEMIKQLAILHTVDYDGIGLGNFGKEGNYYQRQYYRWNKAFQLSLPEGLKSFEELSAWLGNNLPEDGRRTLVHGDFRLDNMVFHPDERSIQAILDWELSTLGDPLSDLGYFLGILNAPKSFILSGFGGEDRSKYGVPEEKEMIDLYCVMTNSESLANWPFYRAFGYFRLSAICAGVQARVNQGNAVDETAKLYGSLTGTIAEIGLKQIEA